MKPFAIAGVQMHVRYGQDNIPAMRRGAPELGEHTREILAELGYASEHIDEMFATGAVGPDEIDPA